MKFKTQNEAIAYVNEGNAEQPQSQPHASVSSVPVSHSHSASEPPRFVSRSPFQLAPPSDQVARELEHFAAQRSKSLLQSPDRGISHPEVSSIASRSIAPSSDPLASHSPPPAPPVSSSLPPPSSTPSSSSAPSSSSVTQPYRIYTDGASRSNPGPASLGYSIQDPSGREIHFGHEYLGVQTNNVAEYSAVLAALLAAQQLKLRHLEILSDSELLIGQVAHNWKCNSKHLLPFILKIRELMKSFESCKFTKIPRALNKRADGLANLALDQRPKGETAK